MKFIALLAFISLATLVTARITETNDASNTDVKTISTEMPISGGGGETHMCKRCEFLIGHLAGVFEDPKKIDELKKLLGVWCDDCPSKEQCHKFVDHLDECAKGIVPWLKDPRKACTHLHFCGNKHLDVFERIGRVFFNKYENKTEAENDLVCEECQFAAHELQTLVNNRAIQQDVRKFVEDNVCTVLGQKYSKTCDTILDEFLPSIWREMHELLENEREFCEQLSLCGRTHRSVANKHKYNRRLMAALLRA